MILATQPFRVFDALEASKRSSMGGAGLVANLDDENALIDQLVWGVFFYFFRNTVCVHSF